jgi:hypothetical protein
MLAQARLYAINALIAAWLLLIAIDIAPHAPTAIVSRIQPLLTRLGIGQGPYAVFAPHPDAVNNRIRAEIKYRDGRQAEWISPTWRELSLWERWTGSRQQEWLDVMLNRPEPAIEPWCRYLARVRRPDLERADEGAEVRLICEEARVPPATERPWSTWRKPIPFRDGVVLSLEYLR